MAIDDPAFHPANYGTIPIAESEVSPSLEESFTATPTSEDMTAMAIDGPAFDPANDGTIPIAEKRSTIEARHPLPSTPSTPRVSSLSHFPSTFASSTPNLGPTTPATTPKPKLRRPILSPHTKNPNPYIDFRDVTGFTDGRAYWENPPFVHRGVYFNKPEVGPFRKAAVYEFIGQTFDNERKKNRKTHRRRHKTFRANQGCFAEGSPLRYVQTADDDEEANKFWADAEMKDTYWPDRWEGWDDFKVEDIRWSK